MDDKELNSKIIEITTNVIEEFYNSLVQNIENQEERESIISRESDIKLIIAISANVAGKIIYEYEKLK